MAARTHGVVTGLATNGSGALTDSAYRIYQRATTAYDTLEILWAGGGTASGTIRIEWFD